MEREVILSDGRRLAATEKNGAGDTLVVLVHGWCCRRSDWHAYLESAPETVSFLAPDLPGHGDSAATPGTWTVAGMARDIADLVRARRPGQVVLVGHSMGGAVALEAAALLESVAAVVFVDTFIIPYGDLSEDDAAGIERGFHEDFPAAVGRLVDANTSDAMPEHRKQALGGQMASAPADKMLPLWGDLLRWNPEPAFAAVTAPLFAINGEMIPEAARQRCAGRVAETVLASPGHFPQWEQPDAFSQALTKQLEALRL